MKLELRCVDCLDWLDEFNDPFIDLAIADPPYNINYNAYDVYKDNLSRNDYLLWCERWLGYLYFLLKKHGSFWLYINDEYVSELDVLAKKIGFIKRSHIIHYYTFGVACRNNFARSHTHFIYYVRDKHQFTFNANSADIRVPSARQLVYKDKRANPDGKLPDNTWVLSPIDLEKAFTPEEDTWLVPRVCGTFRERVERGNKKKRSLPQMPEKIVERAILATSRPGDVVFDPFLGTGTTGVVAIRHGRCFYGCDISEHYVERARRRIEAEMR